MNKNIIIDKANELLKSKNRVIIALDGRCASGKTTLCESIADEIDCNIIHMDDFFLTPEKRTVDRLKMPGGNFDCERFYSEVLSKLITGEEFSYRPYLCKENKLGDEIFIKPGRVTIVEGAYSCHPLFWDCYDLHVFLDVPENEQIKRIEKRNGKENAELFCNKWIPLEELYFKTFDIENKCELRLSCEFQEGEKQQ